jgi:hypothetical protein
VNTFPRIVALIIAICFDNAFADHPSVDFGTDTSGPISTIPATTLPKGVFGFGMRAEYVETDRYGDMELEQLAGRHIHAHSADFLLSPSISVVYGVTEDLTLGAQLPYIHRDNLREGHHHHEEDGGVINEVEKRGDSRGFGDLTLLGKYRFLDHGWQAALLFGIELPTGQTRDKDREGVRFETEHQPGSGSWDPLLGLAVSKRLANVGFDASVLRAFPTKGAQHTELGDRMHYSVGLSYRLANAVHLHEEGGPHSHSSWDLILELNGEWEGRQRIRGETEDDSGGNVIYLSPGVRFTSGNNWSGVLSVGVPVAQSIRRSHPENDYRVIVGISKAL